MDTILFDFCQLTVKKDIHLSGSLREEIDGLGFRIVTTSPFTIEIQALNANTFKQLTETLLKFSKVDTDSECLENLNSRFASISIQDPNHLRKKSSKSIYAEAEQETTKTLNNFSYKKIAFEGNLKHYSGNNADIEKEHQHQNSVSDYSDVEHSTVLQFDEETFKLLKYYFTDDTLKTYIDRAKYNNNKYEIEITGNNGKAIGNINVLKNLKTFSFDVIDRQKIGKK
ncbi:hypothetical protein Btru_051985 [Bulinus truncatus]|nr:hypothetical protein Btru_051985 [Bulinus truncatus]